MSKCRGCGAELVWGRTSNGKAIPLDPEPTIDGNVLLTADTRFGRLARILPKDELAVARELFDRDRNLYRTHFASCPQSASFRKTMGGQRDEAESEVPF